MEPIPFISLRVWEESMVLLHFYHWGGVGDNTEQGGDSKIMKPFIAVSFPMRSPPPPSLSSNFSPWPMTTFQLTLNSPLQNFYWPKLLKPDLAVIFAPMEKHVLQEQLTLYNLADPGGLIALQSHTAVSTQPCITKIKSFSVWNDVIHFRHSLEPSALHVVSVQ